MFMMALVPSTSAEAIIIDHNCTDLSKIPADWINQSKVMFNISYGHTSHGSQIVTGMNVIKNPAGSLYWWDHDGTQSGLSLYDSTPSGDLGNPDRTTWAARTRTMLNNPDNDRNMVMWSWCGQADTTPENMQIYLDLMSGLEVDYPYVTFIYMTGHLAGSGEAGNLNQRNNQIRAHCIANNSVLFDFADIESYDPDGNYFLDKGANDNCDYWIDSVKHNWATEWCDANPSSDLCEYCDCAHSQPLNCNLKGRAFWWMMARLAGWNGEQDCLGTCCNDTSCTDSFATNVNCSSCTAAGKYWQPNKDTACFNATTPSDLCLSYCPECCDGKDNDTDTYIDYPADAQCTCGLDPSETTASPPIPEASTIVLMGVGLIAMSVILLVRRRKRR